MPSFENAQDDCFWNGFSNPRGNINIFTKAPYTSTYQEFRNIFVDMII
jgi:hypothetical protein